MARHRLIVLLCIAITPALAAAAGAANTYGELVNQLVSLMNSGVVVLVALGVAIYFYGIYSNVLQFGEENPDKKKAFFFWGIIILFVMVSIWGILRLLQNTFFSGGIASSQNQLMARVQKES